jgi:CRP/FNR family cyclic AMP-dependent transcriptional regulator
LTEDEEYLAMSELNDKYILSVGGRMIKNSVLGEELSDQQCALLAEVITVRGLREGEFLLEEGHQDDSIHVIVKGKLEVLKQTGGGDWVTLHMLKEGDMAGELGFIDGMEHTAALRAIGDCEVFSLERQNFESLLNKDAALVYQVMRAIIRTVHSILRRMNAQYVELTNYVTKQHGRY